MADLHTCLPPATKLRFRFKPLPTSCLFYRPGLISKHSSAPDRANASATAVLNRSVSAILNSKCEGAAFQTACKRKTQVQGIQPNAHGEACCAHHEAKRQGLICPKTAHGAHNDLGITRPTLRAIVFYNVQKTSPIRQAECRTRWVGR